MSECCNGHEHDKKNDDKNNKLDMILTIIGIVIFAFSIYISNLNEIISLIGYILSYALIGYEIVFNAFKRLFKKDMFDENFLMMLATFGAFAIGEYTEAVAVILFYKIGELLQDKAVENSKKKISETIDIRATSASVKREGVIYDIKPEELKIKDIVVIKTGEKIPVDGKLLSDSAQLDMSALTGESKPVSLNKEQEVLSGSVNIGSLIELEVTKTFENSTVSRIIEMIENANSKKSNTEKFITRFAKIYTPIVTIIAILIALMPLFISISYVESLHRAFTFLVISCPCALVISVPLGFFVGIGTTSKKGILIKGSNYLDNLASIKTVIFDKTGTLTKGVFEVTKIISFGNMSEQEIIEKIALCEYYSNHYIAKSILNYYGKNIDTSKILSHEEIAGKGLKVKIEGQDILTGNYILMEENNIAVDKVIDIGTVCYLAINNKCEGCVILSDVLKEDIKDLISSLNNIGIKRCIMLTGDSSKVAKSIGESLGIKEVYSELLPEDKANIFEKIKKEEKENKIAYLGDGINDSPVLAMADVGISMGKGSDIAIETSDVVIMSDEPSKLIDAVKIARRTRNIVKENIIFAIAIKVLFLILSSLGMTSMWFAIFADVGVALITILNSIRIFYKFK